MRQAALLPSQYFTRDQIDSIKWNGRMRPTDTGRQVIWTVQVSADDIWTIASGVLSDFSLREHPESSCPEKSRWGNLG